MTANLDTKALRALLKLMENRVRFDDGMESLIAAAPALLDAAEELRSLRAELDVSRSVGSNLYQGAEAVMAERDALKAEVAKAYANAAYHADMAQKLKAEVERLRADVAAVCDDWVHGDEHTTDWLLSRLMPIAQRGFALRSDAEFIPKAVPLPDFGRAIADSFQRADAALRSEKGEVQS